MWPHATTSTSLTQKTVTITVTASGTSVFHGSNPVVIASRSNITIVHGPTTATISESKTVTSYRSTTTRTASASSSAAALDAFASQGSPRKLPKGVIAPIALVAGKIFVPFLAHYLSRNQVIVVGLILMFAWQRRTERRHAQKLPRGSVFDSDSSQGTWASEPEKARSEEEASPGMIPTALMPARKPSLRRDVTGSEFTKGYRSDYVDNIISWKLAVETRKYPHYKSASYPGSLPSPYETPWVAPPG